ncbi:hypothetical protein B0H34DRAFT_649917 [Crassisporium funariophilum]|nr:hypothetical protein B0H34DRAFT_649917 [Crassisporium funariophilum]
MYLYLSSRTPWNTTYCTEEGQVIYSADTPHKYSESPITIKRILPSVNFDAQTADSEDTLRDQFSHLAEIEYHSFRDYNSRIRYAGQDVAVSEFFTKKGWSCYGRYAVVLNRVFKGPDGKEYTWHLSSSVCKLVTNDALKNPIASYHTKSLGFLSKARAASLEIFPAGEHMIDLILITFIYVERLRRERQRTGEEGGGG